MTTTLRELVDAVLAMRRDLRRLTLAHAPVLSRTEVAELLGCREEAAAEWLDLHEEELRVVGPGRERRYSRPRIEALLERPAPRPHRAAAPKGEVYRLPRPGEAR